MKIETMLFGDKKVEAVRPRTVGADFDMEHYITFCEVCDAFDIDGASLIRTVMYPYLDAKKRAMQDALRGRDE